MKKIVLYAIVLFAFTIAACNKEDAAKDVNASIKKLESFNKIFAELYADGEISTVKEGEENSEYDILKSTGKEYYDLINKINSQIKKEKEDIEEGDDSGEYQEQYAKALKDKAAEITAAKELFDKNIAIIEAVK